MRFIPVVASLLVLSGAPALAQGGWGTPPPQEPPAADTPAPPPAPPAADAPAPPPGPPPFPPPTAPIGPQPPADQQAGPQTPIQTPPPPPPPPPPPIDPPYFVVIDGQLAGPFTKDVMAQLAAQGRITRDTLVWQEGFAAWQKADAVAALKPIIAAIPPPVDPALVRDEQFRKFILGTWEARSQLNQGGYLFEYVSQIRYTADGRLSGTQHTYLSGNYMSATPLAGTWTLQAIDDRRFTLTLNLQGQAAQASQVSVIDNMTLQNETAGVTARRVGN